MQVAPSFHEIDYFPCERVDISQIEEESNDQKEPIQIRVFKEFVEFLSINPHMIINLDNGIDEITKAAIAFFIEATRQLNGNQWQTTIQDVKGRIQILRDSKTDQSEIYKETTWLLNALISNLYLTSLRMHIAYKGTEKTRKEFLERTVTRWQSMQELRDMLRAEKQEVTIGGINVTMQPRWYTENFITEG